MRGLATIMGIGSLVAGVPPACPASTPHLPAEPVRLRLVRFPSPPAQVGLDIAGHHTPRHATFYGAPVGSLFGSAIAPAGDVNGDGFADVVVSAKHYGSSRQARAGAAVLLMGSSTGLVANVGWRYAMNRANRHFGHAIVGGQDVNGDGLPDLIISALQREQPGPNRGWLALFFGSTNTISPTSDWEYLPEDRGSGVGTSLALADVNRDGFPDLIAGAARHSKLLDEEGAVFVFIGSPEGFGTTPTWSAHGPAAKSEFGQTVVMAGDVNGDGYPDVLVGAPEDPAAGPRTGSVFLYAGGPSGLSHNPIWTAHGPDAKSEFGRSIASVGDVNGDGCSDFAVGSPQRGSLGASPGATYLYLGARSTMATNPAWVAMGEAAGARFGASVAGLGDVNGDGLGDILIGSPDLSLNGQPGIAPGRAYLYLGMRGGFEAGPTWTVDGANAFRVGQVTTALGDLNADGFNDFALGLPTRRRVDIFYGGTNGFARGDDFPVDGISAEISPRPSPAPGPGFSVTPVTVPSPEDLSHRKWIPRPALVAVFALLPALIAGFVVVIRRRQRAAANLERARIARDLHDDLGAQLTTLSLLMDTARRPDDVASTAKPHDALIAKTAREILTSMDEVIWSESPESDTLEALVTFIIQYSSQFFSTTPTECRCKSPTSLPNKTLRPQHRKSIFLAVKEGLNNVAKHAQATRIEVRIAFNDPHLTIEIEDDGNGSPPPVDEEPGAGARRRNERGGNGLVNMRQRMKSIGGSFEVAFRPGVGTCVKFAAKI